MEGKPALYLGRIVSKEQFRAFIYSPDGSQRLVNSWEEFEKFMETGLWFALKEDAINRIPVEKPKRTRKEASIEESRTDEQVFEVNEQDDFLPKARK